jgi:metal-responsive CopG/Arc/MetJ family transcriptional regulator
MTKVPSKLVALQLPVELIDGVDRCREIKLQSRSEFIRQTLIEALDRKSMSWRSRAAS